MTATPGYFGEDDRRVFGWLELPAGELRGGVVLCPMAAVEEMSSHPALRLLAEQLGAEGLASVRFDYPGTGDSAGELDEDATVEHWIGAIRAATVVLSSVGAQSLALLGLRLGALLAAEAAATCDGLEALVLWDPPASGRAWLREQQALRRMSVSAPPEDDHGVELLGLVLPEGFADSLLALDPTTVLGPAARPTLAVVREDRPPKGAFAACLAREGTTVLARAGQAEFTDVLPDASVIPTTTIGEISDWLVQALGGPQSKPMTHPPGPHPLGTHPREAHPLAEHLVLGGYGLVEEHPVRFGGHDLFGVQTAPLGGGNGASVVLLNAGLLRHVGPARLWVSLARALAAEGFSVLRFDLAGLGDSPARPGRPRQQSYPLAAVEDVTDAAHVLSPDDPAAVVLGGLCAGAYHSLEAGIALGVRAVCAINPLLSFDPADFREPGAPRDPLTATQPYRAWVQRLRDIAWLRGFAERIVPRPGWWLLDRFGAQHAPGRGPAALVAAGSALLLCCGDNEADQFLRRSPAQWRAMRRDPRFSFSLLSGADHALLGADARRRATEVVLAHARENWKVPTEQPASPLVNAAAR